jgi:hypothetical protein
LTGEVLLGREGDPALRDPRVSRRHALVRPAAGQRPAGRRRGAHEPVARVADLGSSNGTRVRRRGHPRWTARRISPTRRPGDGGRTLRTGDQLVIGRDRFEVRDRPGDLSWPAPPPPRGRAARVAALPLLMALSLLGWRLAASGAVTPGATAAGIAAMTLVAGGVLVLLRERRRRRWARHDAAGLALVIAALPASAPPARSGDRPAEPSSARVWPARAGPRGAVTVGLGADARGGDAVRTLGAVGPHARAAARWWCAQVAARTGGATVREGPSPPRVLGDGRTEVHLVDRPECPVCERGPGAVDVLHIGVASAYAELPAWCERVIAADLAPASSLWWEQTAPPRHPDAGQEPCDPPTSVPFGERVRAADRLAASRPGSLRVVLGRDARGPVTVDLAEDGPHALVAGTTGSGKSEALATWLLAMCEQSPPEDLRLVLVDYKGGAAFAPLAGLPQTEAVLTDLDPQATDRAVRGLRALLVRRERELAGHGLADLTRWQRAHERGEAPPAPPRVIVAVDEFRVLSESHPHTLDSLVRLASQGRSLGIHLIVATQRPSGAVTPAMRANIEVRLALRCVDEADSLDILGTPDAARLPRVPGRALLRGGGPFQVAWAEDTGSAVRRVAARWASAGERRHSLWAPALPEDLGWTRVEEVAEGWPGPPGGVALGLVDGIDRGGHPPLIWTGGSLRVEGPQHAAVHLARTALALGGRIGDGRGAPLHVCSRAPRPPGRWASWLDVEDAGACAQLLAGVTRHAPAVVVVDDVEAMAAGLDLALGPGRGRALWTRLLGEADRSGVVVVAATPGQWGATGQGASAFAWRLAHVVDDADALHAGLPSTTPRCRVPGRFLLVRAPGGVPGALGGTGGEPLVCQIPRELRPGRGPGSESPEADRPPQPWSVASLSGPPPGGDSGDRGSVALVGPELRAFHARAGHSWLVVGDRPDRARASIVRAHREAGLPPPDIRVLGSHAWMQIRQSPDRTVLAADPGADVLRVLHELARTADPALAAECWEEGTGVILDRGYLARMALRSPPAGLAEGPPGDAPPDRRV